MTPIKNVLSNLPLELKRNGFEIVRVCDSIW